DVGILLEVIEHIPDPSVFFKSVADLIAPGGCILIATPAVDNLVARFLPSQSPHYVAPSHVSLFTHRAMTALLERHGFTIERMEIDEGVGILDRAAISLLYDLDFVSPRSDDDANDAW